MKGLKARGNALSDSSVTDNLPRDVLPTGSWKLASVLCDLEFCRCPALCFFKRPVLTSRFHGSCEVGTGQSSGPKGPSPPEDSASSDFAANINFAILGGRTSPTDSVAAALVVRIVLDQDDPASPSPEDSATASRVVALCSANPLEAELHQQP